MNINKYGGKLIKEYKAKFGNVFFLSLTDSMYCVIALDKDENQLLSRSFPCTDTTKTFARKQGVAYFKIVRDFLNKGVAIDEISELS